MQSTRFDLRHAAIEQQGMHVFVLPNRCDQEERDARGVCRLAARRGGAAGGVSVACVAKYKPENKTNVAQ